MNVGIIGLNKPSLASAIALSIADFKVKIYDSGADAVSKFERGGLTEKEMHMQSLLREQVASKSLALSKTLEECLEGCNVAFIFSSTKNSVSFNTIERVAKIIGPKGVIALRGEGSPGDTKSIKRIVEDKIGKTLAPSFAYSPHFIYDGSAMDDALNADSTVIGTDSLYAYMSIYDVLHTTCKKVILTSIETAEMAKSVLSLNRAFNQAFNNASAEMCQSTGASWSEMRDIIQSVEPGKLNNYSAGIGLSGSILHNLIETGKTHMPFSDYSNIIQNAGDAINQKAVNMLENEVGSLNGKFVSVWGLTDNFSNLADEPAAKNIIKIIEGRGGFALCYDANIKKRPEWLGAKSKLHIKLERSLKNSSGVILLSSSSKYQKVKYHEMSKIPVQPVIYDGTGILSGPILEKSGWKYLSLGN
jgi:nucleotide sugar dehydrogenase